MNRRDFILGATTALAVNMVTMTAVVLTATVRASVDIDALRPPRLETAAWFKA